MEGLIDEDRDGEMFADSAYSGEPIRQMLSAKKIKSRINEKGYRNNPLTDKQISLNQTKSKIRARVEHVFGFMENNMSANKIRSIGKERANRSIGLGNLIYNFFRFTQLNYTMIWKAIEKLPWLKMKMDLRQKSFAPKPKRVELI